MGKKARMIIIIVVAATIIITTMLYMHETQTTQTQTTQTNVKPAGFVYYPGGLVECNETSSSTVCIEYPPGTIK